MVERRYRASFSKQLEKTLKRALAGVVSNVEERRRLKNALEYERALVARVREGGRRGLRKALGRVEPFEEL